jgi:hypothetical protein
MIPSPRQTDSTGILLHVYDVPHRKTDLNIYFWFLLFALHRLPVSEPLLLGRLMDEPSYRLCALPLKK